MRQIVLKEKGTIAGPDTLSQTIFMNLRQLP